MKTFRAGLVGTGYICEYHIAALRRLPHVELCGLYDIDAAKAVALGEKLNIPVYPSLEALQRAGANVIHVLTPPHTHAAVVLAALNLGCHVLVEKPLAVDVEDCDRIESAAAARGLKVCVNHSLLFDPQVRRALETVRAGKLGRVVSVDILRSSAYPPWPGGPLPPQYRTAGYPFRDLGVHALYLFEAFLGPIVSVDAQWRSLGGDPNLTYDEWRALVRCREGLGQFQLSWNVNPLQHQLVIQGTRGVLRVDLFAMFHGRREATPLPKAIERVYNACTDCLPPMWDVARGAWGYLRKKILPYHGLQDLVAAFYQSLEGGAAVPVSVADARRVVQWTEQIGREADEEGAARRIEFTLSEKVPVLVTGASGGLGGAVVERLRAEGTPVRVLLRRLPERVPPGVEIVRGDLGDPEAVERAVRGARTVIHAGAAMKGGWIEHQRGTVTGTLNILQACARHRVEMLVHVSSLSVVDWAAAPGSPLTEETPHEPRAAERGAYTRAKLEAEQLVTRFVREQKVPAVILRPGQIFGGKIPLLTPAVARRFGTRWIILGNGELRLPLVYLDDVVDAVLMAREGSLRNGEIVQLVDTALTQNEVLARVLGNSAAVWRLPRALVFGLGMLSETGLALLKRQSPLNRYRLRSALADHSFVSLNAESQLGWIPQVGVREGIRRVIEGTVLTRATGPLPANNARNSLKPEGLR